MVYILGPGVMPHINITWSQRISGVLTRPATKSITQLAQCLAKAKVILATDKSNLILLNDEMYKYNDYIISIATWACTCMSFFRTGKLCKHGLAAQLHHGLPDPDESQDHVVIEEDEDPLS